MSHQTNYHTTVSCEVVKTSFGHNGSPNYTYCLQINDWSTQLHQLDAEKLYTELRAALFPDAATESLLRGLKGDKRQEFSDLALERFKSFAVRMEEYEFAAGINALKTELKELREWQRIRTAPREEMNKMPRIGA